MRFERRLRDGLADGSISVAYRRWKRSQVVAGRRYRTGAGMVEVTDVRTIEPASITDEDARLGGYASAAAALADLRGPADLPAYRLALRPVEGPDPRTVLSEDDDLDEADVAEIDRRLARLDRASSHGAWTEPVLRLIAARPAVRAPDLARSLGRETRPFKVDVRKLKALGLTHSLDVGYRLSPRGRAYLAARDRRAATS